MLTAEHRTRHEFDHATGRAGIRYRVAFETSSPQVAQALAAAGHGIAIVSDDPRYDLRPLGIATGDGPLHINLHAAWDHSHYATDVVASLAARLSAFCVARYGRTAEVDEPERSRPATSTRP